MKKIIGFKDNCEFKGLMNLSLHFYRSGDTGGKIDIYNHLDKGWTPIRFKNSEELEKIVESLR